MSLRRGVDLEIRIQRIGVKSGRPTWIWEIARGPNGVPERSEAAYYNIEDAFHAAWKALRPARPLDKP